MDLGLLPLVFSLILTVASRLLHPYSTDDKTSRLMVKKFSTVRETQRGSQSYMEKRRGSREIEVTRRRRGGVKRGESSLASNQLPMCSLQPRAPTLGTLLHASSLHWSFILHMVIYMFQCCSLKSSHPCILPHSPKVCSLHLCLFCCLA